VGSLTLAPIAYQAPTKGKLACYTAVSYYLDNNIAWLETKNVRKTKHIVDKVAQVFLLGSE